jgi:hypothetical protein
MIPGRYTKKPVTIEAMRLDFEDNDCVESIMKWIGDDILFYNYDTETNHFTAAHIKTLEGPMFCTQGDYIIKGVKGEFYPCKPDIFAETYSLED